MTDLKVVPNDNSIDDSGVQKFLDSCQDHAAFNTSVGFELEWSKEGVGFGRVWFYINPDTGALHMDNECMSKGFIKEMICKAIDEAVSNEPSSRDPK